MIHFTKHRQTAAVIMEISQYQDQPYCLALDEDIRRFLLDAPALDDDALYALSLKLEPRGADKAASFPSTRRKRRIRIPVAGSVVASVLQGLGGAPKGDAASVDSHAATAAAAATPPRPTPDY